jgi:phosphoglycolate phosphatase
MKYKYVIFDFDGTLFDSRKGIIASINFALDQMNIKIPSEEILTSFIGPPLGDSFQKHFNLTKSDTELAIVKLREHYGDHGHLQSIPYEGCLELIQELLRSERILGIATAKPTAYATRILQGNFWSGYFQSVRGSDLIGELFPKEKTIGQVINDFKIYDKEDCVMIGDTIYDIKGAQEHGIDTIAVNYGYGKTQDLKDAKPSHFVETISELKNVLLS